jgi:hypothetical protein
MYCPKCKAEYREGFIKCSDCSLLLVDKLPPETEEPEGIPEYVDLKEIMTSFDQFEIAVVKSILDDHKISCLVQGENFSTCYGSIPSRILVPKENVDEALDLIQDFL